MNLFDTVIIGAGPAGLTAALELVRKGRRNIIVLEADNIVGGLSRTVNYKGNRIDIGGHRFFSKSDWVMQWWQEILPLAAPENTTAQPSRPIQLKYHGQSRELISSTTVNESAQDNVMLIRSRLSRILFSGKFFDYPLKPSLSFINKLGWLRCFGFGLSYCYSHLFPRKPEVTLEDFFINRFGKKLYEQFFKEYTEKVWGRSCQDISAEWGAQRIKSLSIGKALWHGIRSQLKLEGSESSKQITSLIESFLYPKFGPGQMWERVAELLRQDGINVELGARVNCLTVQDGRICTAQYVDKNGEQKNISAQYFVSTMPVKDLIKCLGSVVPQQVTNVAQGLEYRDFITVGLLYKKLNYKQDQERGGEKFIPDNWIYIQEPGVKVGRLQIFNNWSPYMVSNSSTIWVGLEFFCQEGDALWLLSDEQLIDLAKREMQQLKLGLIEDVVDGVAVRMPKAYPGYYGTYQQFDQVRTYLDAISNLFLIGRNGMHRYNNQDHSMLSARAAVECIIKGDTDKSSIWAINVDDDYHEIKK